MTRSEAGKMGYKKSKIKLTHYYQKFIDEYNLNPKRCKQCGNTIVYENRRLEFCNHSCSAIYTNSRRAKPKVHCLNCNELTTIPNKFCSVSCHQDYLHKQWVADWLAGKLTGTNYSSYSTHIKKYLIDTYGNNCSKCGWDAINPKTSKVPIQLDHRDGDWTNNDPNNVRLLCPNCHSLTPTFGGLNRGKGRKYRYANVA